MVINAGVGGKARLSSLKDTASDRSGFPPAERILDRLEMERGYI
jgi:hypothetical protein